MDEVNAIPQKMELLMKKLDERANFTMDREAIQQQISACNQNIKQSTKHEVAYAINNLRPQKGGTTSRFKSQGNTKSSSPSLRKLVMSQAKVNENINNKLLAHEKILKIISTKMKSFATSIKDELYFIKMLESQIKMVASFIPSPIKSCNSLNVVAMRGGKTTRDPPYPNMTRKPTRKDKEEEEEEKEDKEELPSTQEKATFYGKIAPHDFYDTNLSLPFPRTKK